MAAQTCLTIRHGREYGAFMALARRQEPRAGHAVHRALALRWLLEAYPQEFDALTAQKD